MRELGRADIGGLPFATGGRMPNVIYNDNY